jgi:hypothetical protein
LLVRHAGGEPGSAGGLKRILGRICQKVLNGGIERFCGCQGVIELGFGDIYIMGDDRLGADIGGRNLGEADRSCQAKTEEVSYTYHRRFRFCCRQ